MKQRLPPLAVLLGIAGLVPFIVCTIGTISDDRLTGDRAVIALIGYGAVILAFLGGIHWGFVLSPAVADDNEVHLGVSGTQPRTGTRLIVGVLPALVGWLALLTPIVASPNIGLAVLLVGFLTTAIAETQAARAGLVAYAYLWMRWPLTLIVAALLTTAMTLRVLGVLIKI